MRSDAVAEKLIEENRKKEKVLARIVKKLLSKKKPITLQNVAMEADEHRSMWEVKLDFIRRYLEKNGYAG